MTGPYRPNKFNKFRGPPPHRRYEQREGRRHESPRPKKHHQQSPSVFIQETIALKEVREGNLSDRLTKVLEALYANTASKCEDDTELSLKISVHFQNKKEANRGAVQQEENDEDAEEVAKSLGEALDHHLEKKKKQLAELPGKLKKLKEKAQQQEDDDVPEQGSPSGKKQKRNSFTEVSEETSNSPAKKFKRKHSLSNSEENGDPSNKTPNVKKQKNDAEKTPGNNGIFNTSVKSSKKKQKKMSLELQAA